MVSYFAIEPQNMATQYISETGNTVTHEWFNQPFGAQAGDGTKPAFFGQMQTFNGPDTATLRYQNLDNNGATFKVEEEKS
jgi:hypothetical protein